MDKVKVFCFDEKITRIRHQITLAFEKTIYLYWKLGLRYLKLRRFI
jgi:hypothetical protein